MYCIWLTFYPSDLLEIIIKLAQKYDGPVFHPHCTLVGKTDVPLPRMKSAVINLLSKSKLKLVHPGKISYTNNIWRTLYIELREKQVLRNWHENICDLLSINYDKDYLPHISLMYNSILQEEKQRISGKIQLKTAYKIKSIQIVDCSGRVDGWNPIFELKI